MYKHIEDVFIFGSPVRFRHSFIPAVIGYEHCKTIGESREGQLVGLILSQNTGV